MRKGEVETLEYHRDRGVSVTVYRGKSKGSASSGDLGPESVQNCVIKAAEIARFTQPDEFAGLPDPDRLASEFPELDLWHPQELPVETVIENATLVEAAGLNMDERIVNSEGGGFSASQAISLLANSDGFSGRSWGTNYSQSCAFIAADEAGMQRDYWYDNKHALVDLDPLHITGEIAAQRSLARLGARSVKTERMPVIFNPQVAAGLLGHFIAAISGGNLYRNASYMKDRLHSQVFPEALSLQEQPLLKRGASSASFDAEGVKTSSARIVNRGQLEEYLLNSYSARKLGMTTNGHAGGVHNLIVEAPAITSQHLLADMGDGLLVTEVMGQGVNIVTGDYSRGASGFLIKNGQIEHAVDEVTIAGNLAAMFMDIIGIGNDVDARGRIHAPSVLVASMMVAGE